MFLNNQKKSKLIYLFFIVIIFSCNNTVDKELQSEAKAVNKPEVQGQVNKEEPKTELDAKKIIGSWKDNNSIIEYKENGNWIGEWEQGALVGKWGIKKDVFSMSFLGKDIEPTSYRILELNDTLFKISSIQDGAIFVKKKIDFTFTE